MTAKEFEELEAKLATVTAAARKADIWKALRHRMAAVQCMLAAGSPGQVEIMWRPIHGAIVYLDRSDITSVLPGTADGEHGQLMKRFSEELTTAVSNAVSIVLGKYSSEVAERYRTALCAATGTVEASEPGERALRKVETKRTKKT